MRLIQRFCPECEFLFEARCRIKPYTDEGYPAVDEWAVRKISHLPDKFHNSVMRLATSPHLLRSRDYFAFTGMDYHGADVEIQVDNEDLFCSDGCYRRWVNKPDIKRAPLGDDSWIVT